MKILAFQSVIFLTLSSSWCYGQGDNAKIQELLDKAKKVPAYQCEMVSSSYIVGKTIPAPNNSLTRIWHKGQFSKVDLGVGVIVISRPEGTYDYDVKNDKYTKRSKRAISDEISLNELNFLIKDKKWELSILGNEIVDGKNCTVISAKPIDKKASFSFSSKYWIWSENGLLIRVEITGKRGTTISITTVNSKNFIFNNIPDGVFTVPAEKIIDKSDAIAR